eukprot:Skav225570  [mRNA]  locus=scaffold81:486018:495663:+ [translate_table: standard]
MLGVRQVLLRLQKLFDPAMVVKTDAGPPGMAEQLDLAEFTLKRITHAVNLLQDHAILKAATNIKHIIPARDPKQLLQGYTDAMTAEVCTDLRQWLEKLADLLSFYHMYILDCEREKRCLREKMNVVEAKYQENQDRLTFPSLNEFKMKRRAEALFGLNLDDEDSEVASAAQGIPFPTMVRSRTEKYVAPLLEELEDLRNQLDQGRFASKRNVVARAEEPTSPTSQMSGAQRQLLSGALFAASARAPDPLGDLLWQLGDRAGDDYKDIALAIQALPPLDPRLAQMGDAAAILDANDLDLLQTALKATSDYVQGELGEELIRFSKHFATNSPELPEIVRAIREISSPKAAARGACRSVGVNTTASMVLPTAPGDSSKDQGPTTDFRAELERLRAQLEAELRAAREEAERQRRRAEEAMEKLEAEAKRADGLMSEMRKKLQTMQSVLQKSGLDKEAEAALQESGLSTFIKGRDVFERLYQDALRRMRVQAENQLRLLTAFLQALQSLATHPMTAVDAALELHGARILKTSAPSRVVGPRDVDATGDFKAQPRRKETEGGEGKEGKEGVEGKRAQSFQQRFRTASLGSFDSKPRTPVVVKGRGISRAATLGPVGQAWASTQTLRQTLFTGPGPGEEPRELEESKQSPSLPRPRPDRPGTGNGHRSRPSLVSNRPASGGAKTSPMLTVNRLCQ